MWLRRGADDPQARRLLTGLERQLTDGSGV